MQTLVSQLVWESAVWIAEDPEHMIHCNGEKFLGPYPDVLPRKRWPVGVVFYLAATG